MLTVPKIVSVCAELEDVAAKHGATFAVAGGACFVLLGYYMPTEDIDVISDKDLPEDLKTYDRDADGYFMYGKAHLKFGGVKVDWVPRHPHHQALFTAAFAGSFRCQHGPNIVSPEFAVAIKIGANREKDWNSLILLTDEVSINWSLVDDLVREFLPAARHNWKEKLGM